MSKILSDGYVRKSGRISVILDKIQNRLVDLPDTALRLNYDKKFYEPEQGDHLIFSAQMQNGRYCAVSAVRPSDLIPIYGTLSYFDDQLKFGHVSVQGKTAKVFVPFSTRTANGACWYGQGAYLEKPYLVHVFRQEEAHGCKYVAWAIFEDNRKPATLPPQHLDVHQSSTMKKLGSANIVHRQSDHQSVEFVQNQTGVIYDVSSNNVVSVTSPTCQNVEFAANLYQSWMKPGRFISFDGRRVSDVKTSKLMGSNPEDLGSIFPIRHNKPLTITVSAVMNKVSHGKAGWAWNDHVGRIYVPWMSTDRYMTSSRPLPFTPCHLEIAYNGKHDDIPWVASASSLCDEHEFDEIVERNCRMLKTEDNWKIHSIADGPDNPSIFLQKLDENGKKRCAFAKVIDLNSGDVPPIGTLVRITYCLQERHGRHAIRCVLVSMMERLEKDPKKHLVINGSGEKYFPKLFEKPTAKRTASDPPQPKVQAAPPPVKNYWNLKNLGSPKTCTTDFPTVVESKSENSLVTADNLSEKADSFSDQQDSSMENEDLAETTMIAHPPGILPPPGLSPLTITPKTEEFAPLLQLDTTIGSVWSGTPVAAKPENNASFFLNDNFLNSPFGPLGSNFPADPFFAELTTSVSQPSTSNSGPISDLRNTQSEASSPGLKSDGSELTEEQANCWTSLGAATSTNSVNNNNNNNNAFNSSFAYGFPLMDLPYYQTMMPSSNVNEVFCSKPTTSTPKAVTNGKSLCHSKKDTCKCGSEQVLWDLFQNPNFVAAFSATDPETFRRIDSIRHNFKYVNRH